MKQRLIISASVGLLFLLIGWLRPVRFHSETSIFVPLTMLERQIQQNGIGFGSPEEIDAHIELMRSPLVEEALEERFPGSATELKVSKTRNGAVLIECWTDDAEDAAAMAMEAISITDSLKQIMLIQNVGQSHRFVAGALRESEEEMGRIQHILDSLRLAFDQDSLILASEVYKYNGMYSAEVQAMNDLKQRLSKLDSYMQAPAPESYVIYPAAVAEGPFGPPAWLMMLIGWGLTFLFLHAVRLYRSTVTG
jgi:hypothetical protein